MPVVYGFIVVLLVLGTIGALLPAVMWPLTWILLGSALVLFGAAGVVKRLGKYTELVAVASFACLGLGIMSAVVAGSVDTQAACEADVNARFAEDPFSFDKSLEETLRDCT